MVRCPTCRKMHEYDKKSPWRPFCCERCKLIDLGAWASGEYRIEGEPGSASPEFIEEEMTRAREADLKSRRK